MDISVFSQSVNLRHRTAYLQYISRNVHTIPVLLWWMVDLHMCQPILPVCLTHWGRNKMAAFFQMMFPNAFSWKKLYEFRLRFHWRLFLRVQLTIYHHWLRFYSRIYALLAILAWISNNMLRKVWHEWISNLIPQFMMDVITYPCWD